MVYRSCEVRHFQKIKKVSGSWPHKEQKLTLELEIAALTIGLPVPDMDLDSSLCSSKTSAAAHTLRGRMGKSESDESVCKKIVIKSC